METDRIFRFSYSGVAFISCFVYFNHLFGGTFFEYLIRFENMGPIIGVVFSTPLIGFIISTISYFLLDIFGYNLVLYKHTNSSELYKKGIQDAYSKIIWGSKHKIESSDVLSSINCWCKRKRRRRLMFIHQAIIRSTMPAELLNFCVRRITVFYTHLNIISAIILAFLLAFFSGFEKNCSPPSEKWWILGCWVNYIPLALISLYILAGIYHMIAARREATEIEVDWILNYKMLNEVLKPGDPKNPPTPK